MKTIRRGIRDLLKLVAASALLSVAILSSASAVACIVEVPFSDRTIDYAETVFRGRPIAYEAFPDEFAVARVTFDVEETYRGAIAETWVAVWQNSTFEVPNTLADYLKDYGDDVVVGLAPPGTIAPIYAPSATVIAPKEPMFWEIPWVVQAPCAPPFMNRHSDLEPVLRRHGVID